MSGIGPYEVLDRIGEGASGTVYRARRTGDGAVVAVKEVLAPAGDAATRLRAEASVLRGLTHPHVVAVLDLVEDADRVWLVSEFVDGAGLSRVLAAHGPLQPEQALLAVQGALSGLAFAHRRGIVHGDVSLDNLLLTADGTTKLVDFGLAGPVGTAGSGGTPAFVAPEVVAGGTRTPASDVYSAAAVLWTLLAGRPPFPGGDVGAVLRAHVERPTPRLEGHGPELADLLVRAMDKDPARRPADAGALLAELEDAAEHRHGAGWAARTSLAGLAATAAGTHVAASVVGAGASAPGASAVFASTVLGTGARAATSTRKWLVAGAAVVGAAVCAGAVVVLTTGGTSASDASRQDESAASRATSSRSAASAALQAAAPTGNYTLEYVVTSDSGVGYEVVGSGNITPWKGIELTCGPDTCTGSIPFDDGDGTAAFGGDTLSVTGTIEVVLPCFDRQTGESVPGATATVNVAFTVEATVTGTGTGAGAGGRPVLTGTMELTWTHVSSTGGCEVATPGTTTRDVTLTPS